MCSWSQHSALPGHSMGEILDSCVPLGKLMLCLHQNDAPWGLPTVVSCVCIPSKDVTCTKQAPPATTVHDRLAKSVVGEVTAALQAHNNWSSWFMQTGAGVYIQIYKDTHLSFHPTHIHTHILPIKRSMHGCLEKFQFPVHRFLPAQIPHTILAHTHCLVSLQ